MSVADQELTVDELRDCAQCELTTTVEDAGIGWYECGGMIGNDVRYHLVVQDDELKVDVTGTGILPEEATVTLHHDELETLVTLTLERCCGDEAGRIWAIYSVEQH